MKVQTSRHLILVFVFLFFFIIISRTRQPFPRDRYKKKFSFSSQMVGIGVWNWQNLRILNHFCTLFLTFYAPKMAKIAKMKWFFLVLSNFWCFCLATICFWPYMWYQWWVWGIYTLLSKKLSIFSFWPHPPIMTQISDLAIFLSLSL